MKTGLTATLRKLEFLGQCTLWDGRSNEIYFAVKRINIIVSTEKNVRNAGTIITLRGHYVPTKDFTYKDKKEWLRKIWCRMGVKI